MRGGRLPGGVFQEVDHCIIAPLTPTAFSASINNRLDFAEPTYIERVSNKAGGTV